MNDPLSFYTSHGSITDPGDYSPLLDAVPDHMASICRAVQGLVLHPFWAPLYGEKVSKEREQEVQLRHVSNMLVRIQEIDDSPLTVERPLEKRLIGNCRDFTVLTCSVLRHKGVPARARCGFGAYFMHGRYEDHWVVEYWDTAERRWQMVDAQLDEFQQKTLKLPFDPLDVPRDQFVVAGTAWQMCRAGDVDPEQFGLSAIGEHGMWWVRQNLVRDIAALNKTELLPWDSWGLAQGMHIDLPAEELSALDQAADLTANDVVVEQVQALYSDSRFRVPETISSLDTSGPAPRLVEVAWPRAG